MRKKSDLSLRARALQCLACREYSRAELHAKLLPHAHAGKGFDQVVESSGMVNLDVLLDDLVSRGWLSDERAVNQLVHAKRSRFGSLRIMRELRLRGIDESLLGDVLPELKESDLEAAQAVWQRKFGKYPQDAKEKARQMRFLQSRGFSTDTIFKIMANTDFAEE